ncbi:hypothetical protein FA13DRAFT_991941 [Coprinellus micaceus]|uniref:Uncharacterized protein n=1 Tax=Coprinellus micaceus TaxID=71717 RepID=A0A4Y7RRC6_COPMI|nr:hypothetical protein FA13DRAFT_991941 [Coprinellus micaceus]
MCSLSSHGMKPSNSVQMFSWSPNIWMEARYLPFTSCATGNSQFDWLGIVLEQSSSVGSERARVLIYGVTPVQRKPVARAPQRRPVLPACHTSREIVAPPTFARARTPIGYEAALPCANPNRERLIVSEVPKGVMPPLLESLPRTPVSST